MLDKEILDDFVAETFELLDEVEPRLIELAQSADVSCVDAETLNAVFRLFHTMKGGAGFLGLNSISSVTHVAETLLDLFRKGKGSMETEHVQALCECIDFIRGLLDVIADRGSDAGQKTEAETLKGRLLELIAALNGTPCGTETPPVREEPIFIDLGDEPEPGPVPDEAAGRDATGSSDISPPLRGSYVQEADEALEAAEQVLLALDRNREDDAGEDLAEAFRALHSLKGNSGFLGFADMERLTHRMETALSAMREGVINVSPGKVGLLLKMLDVLKAAVAEISQGASGEIPGLEIYLDLLDDTMAIPEQAEVGTVDPEGQGHAPPSSREAGRQPEQGFSAGRPPGRAAATPARGEARSGPAGTPGERKTGPNGRLDVRPEIRQDIRQDIRVDIRKLDALINLVGELVIAEAMVTRHPRLLDAESESLERATHMLRRVSRELQDVIMSTRMIPLAGTFRKMIRLVHDLAKKSGKSISLRLLGEATEVDKTLIEQIADPLVHIVRNSADHGIEAPEQRAEAGKPVEATITIEGRHEGGEVWILISDDGRGLNRERILAKARDNGLVGEEAGEWPDERIFRLIFEPGFSTAEQVTDVSGRGVGMDVVRRNIQKLKGKIDIRSRPGLGSTFILRIPLTLAIIDGMLVRVGSARYTIPMLAIRESVRPEPSWITVTPDGLESVRIRDDFFPILRLHQRFNREPDTREFSEGILVLVDCDRRTIALFVDEILGQQETVIKGLADLPGHSAGISGCTILGDGEVSLILDIPGLVRETDQGEAD